MASDPHDSDADPGAEPAPGDVRGWADLLRRNWSERSHAARRDHYVASLPAEAGPEAWEAQARIDVAGLFWGLEERDSSGWQVLEMGSGVGRLVRPLLDRVAGYTGFDIADGMVDEARRRLAGEQRARFFLGDGASVPVEARDRAYDLILSHAVLIHCPKEVIGALLASAWPLLAPGGELRVQLLADPTDPAGLTAIEAAVPDHETAVRIDREEERLHDPLVQDRYYMGHAFRHAEVEPFAAEHLPGAELLVVRPNLAHVYVVARRPS